jgi:hypothetical protein
LGLSHAGGEVDFGDAFEIVLGVKFSTCASLRFFFRPSDIHHL